MKPRLIIGVLVALGLLLNPSTSYAKGPGHATISGPGLAVPIELGSASQFSSKASELAIESGVWALQTDTAPNPHVSGVQPTGDLGPRYDATFDMGTESLRQQLYPFAVGGPATHTAPGQVLFARRWKGGWYAADAALRRSLVGAGVPTPVPAPVKARTIDAAATTPARHHGVSPSLLVGGCTTAILVIATAMMIRARRERRPRRLP
jgi:hypothetical protein